MPRSVLIKPAVGFFGKLPSSGDFVTRGLTQGLRPFIDHWLTKGLAVHCKTPEIWPETGVRAILNWKGRAVVLLIFPSADKSGRVFPFALCRVAVGAGMDSNFADVWCQSVLTLAEGAIAGTILADGVFLRMNDEVMDDPASGTGVLADSIWCAGIDPVPIPDGGLVQAVEKVFSSASSD